MVQKPDTDSDAGEKYMDPVQHEDNCSFTEEDYEWYVLISSLLRCIRTNLSFASEYNSPETERIASPLGRSQFRLAYVL